MGQTHTGCCSVHCFLGYYHTGQLTVEHEEIQARKRPNKWVKQTSHHDGVVDPLLNTMVALFNTLHKWPKSATPESSHCLPEAIRAGSLHGACTGEWYVPGHYGLEGSAENVGPGHHTAGRKGNGDVPHAVHVCVVHLHLRADKHHNSGRGRQEPRNETD